MRVLFLFIFFTSTYGFAQDSFEYSITVEGLTDKEAYLGYHFGNQKYLLDTAQNNNQEFRFSVSKMPPTGIYFFYAPNAFFEFIINRTVFKLKTSAPNLIHNMQVENSPENLAFNNLQKFTLKQQRVANQLSDSLKKSTDESIKKQLSDEIADIANQVKSYRERLIVENPGTFVSKFISGLLNTTPETNESMSKEERTALYYSYKNSFFQNFNLADSGLLRTPLYHVKVMEYLDKITPMQPDSVIKSVDYILETSASNPETYRYNLVILSNKYEASNTMGMDKVFVHIVEKYYLTGRAPWADEEILGKLQNRINGIKPNLIGSPAPDMILVDTEMQPIFFREIDARFLVLYFYDPDCGHCKKKTPVLQSQYNGLRDKDVEVMAVNVTRDVEKWKKYITDNNLTFINAADPAVQSNFRYEYDIRSTPTVFILDQNKEIVAKKIDVDNIPNVIDVLIRLEDTK